MRWNRACLSDRPHGRWLALAVLLLAAACSEQGQKAKQAAPTATLITTMPARAEAFDVLEETLGTLESLIDPKLGAEVPGRVTRVLAHSGQTVRQGQLLAEIDAGDLNEQARMDAAEINRAETLLAQQERLVERQRSLVGRGFVSQNAVDDAGAQRDAMREQLAVARARAELTTRNVGKARVVSPIDGVIETQIVSPGDYVKVGDPLFRLVGTRKLRGHLPFPEAAAARLKTGMSVSVSSPQSPDRLIEGFVADIRPIISEGSRALDVIVDIENDGSLRAGGTVNAAILVARKPTAVVVPEQSVVLRPAGKVVYAIADGKAQQRLVETGAKRRGLVEIVKGLQPGEIVAVDGAGFLSHGAAVQVRDSGSEGGSPKDKPEPPKS